MNSARRVRSAILLLSCAASPLMDLSASSNPFRDPEIRSGDRCTYTCVLLHSAQTFHQSTELSILDKAGRKQYDFGLTMNWPDGQTTEARSILEADGYLHSVSTTRIDVTSKGKELLKEEIHFEGANPLYPKDAYSSFALFFAMTGLLREKVEKNSFFMVIPSGASLLVRIRSSEVEWVTVPAGRFRCVKLSARLDVSSLEGISGNFLTYFVYLFIPKITLWYMEDPPHLMVKYKGLVLVFPRNQPVEMELSGWNRLEGELDNSMETQKGNGGKLAE